MAKAPMIAGIIISLSVVSLTTFNILDTAIIDKQEGKVVATIDYDFDFDNVESSSSVSSESSTKNEESSQNSTIFSEKTSVDSYSSTLEPSSSSEVSSSIISSMESSSSEAISQTTVTFQTLTKNIENRDVTYYLADIHLARISDLRSCLATDSSGHYGTNITKEFSSMISSVDNSLSSGRVIAAISGDYPFWNGRSGYVIRDGVQYRSNLRSTSSDDLAIYKDGSYETYYESQVSADTIFNKNSGCWQNFSFGPSLIKNGQIAVGEEEEIDGQSRSNNQRTGIAFAGPKHIYFFASKVAGSRSGGKGSSFSLYEMADTFLSLGCDVAYNLDGGDSTSIYYDGTVYMSKRILGDMIYVVER